jgi:outer membrane protein TolC
MRRPAPIALGALMLALASGCAHDPTPAELLRQAPSRPTALPDSSQQSPIVQASAQQVAEAASADDSRAAACADDQVPVPLNLCEAVVIALRNNPRLRAALAAIERARGQEQVAFSPFLPRIDMLNRYVATSSTLSPGAPGPTGAIAPSVIGAPYDAWQTEMQLQWIVHDFGRTAGRYGQAQMRTTIAGLQANRMRETIAFEVAAAYLQAHEAAAVRKIAEEAIRRAEAVLEDTKARRAAGVALRDDVLRIEVELAAARDALVRAREAELAAEARLNNAMGRDASLPLVLSQAPNEPAFAETLAASMQQAIESRPEVNVARDRVASAQFGRQAARGEFLPRLLLRSSFGRVDGVNVENGWQEGVAIHIDMPIYHGGQQRGELRAAEADIRQAVADAQSVLNDISLQVTLAHREAHFSFERIGLARPAVAQGEETVRIVRERFRNGTATPTDVVDAQNSLTRAQQRFVTSRIEYLTALARLAYSTGEAPERYCEPPAEAESPRPIEMRKGD